MSLIPVLRYPLRRSFALIMLAVGGGGDKRRVPEPDRDRPAGEGPPQVWISDVRQKAFLKVDEEGTEAAAATSVGIGVESAPPMFTFDRPFLFVIRERLSGTILFTAVIGDPSG